MSHVIMLPLLHESTCNRVGCLGDGDCLSVLVEVKPSLESFARDNHPEQTFLKLSSHVLAMGLVVTRVISESAKTSTAGSITN